MKKYLILPLLVSLVILSSSAFAATPIPFTDHTSHIWESGIEFVFNRGIVEGYPDGTYRPYQTLNRAELLKVIVESSYSESQFNPYEGDTCFDDIDGTQWYTKYVCYGKAVGIVEGYPDGTFKPEQEVNFVEALKIILIGMNVGLTSTSETSWYMKYYDTAYSKYLIPPELYGDFDHNFSRGQAAEVIMRILSLDADIVQPPFYQDEGGYEPGTVYLGYLQEGDVLDLYLIADSSVSNYSTSEVTYIVLDNNIVEFRPDNLGSNLAGNIVTISGTITLNASEIVHVGTAYLEGAQTAGVVTE